MADAKISALSAVTDLQDADEFLLSRSGLSKKIAGSLLIDGGSNATDQTLKEWTEAEAWEPSGAISRDANNVVTTCNVVWPDGSAGVFTATANDTDTGAIDSYTITHTASGKTVTQSAVTRNSDGAVTTKPALGVS